MRYIYSKLIKLFNEPRGIVSQANNNLNTELRSILPFNLIKYETGTTVDSWQVPFAWELLKADIKIGPSIYSKHDLPLLVPFGTESFSYSGHYKDLRDYIISLPEQPEATPYRTNYYSPTNHKVCIPYKILSSLKDNTEVSIDVRSETKSSYLEILETFIKGQSDNEILISTYNCHPGLGNDNFSGILGLCSIYEQLSKLKNPHYSYRFAIFPETIGAICYINSLSKRHIIKNIICSTVLTCLGGKNLNYTFKDSPIASSYVDAYKKEIIKHIPDLSIYPYTPDGSDERQFSSPNVSIPSFSLCRNRYYEYDQYHTSLDTLQYMDLKSVSTTSDLIFKTLKNVDKTHRVPKSSAKYGEPCLSSYSLDNYSGGGYNSKSSDSSIIYRKIITNLISASNGNSTTEDVLTQTSLKLNLNKMHIVPIFNKLIELGVLTF